MRQGEGNRGARLVLYDSLDMSLLSWTSYFPPNTGKTILMKSIVKVLIQSTEKRGLNVAIVTGSYSAADKVGWTNAKECRRLSMIF